MIGRRAALFSISVSALVCAREPQTPATTIKELAEYMRQYWQFNMRRELAFTETRRRENSAWRVQSVLRRPYDTRQVEKIKEQLKPYEDSVPLVERDLAVARIRDPKERTAKLRKAEAELVTARQAVLATMAPFDREYAKIQEDGESANRRITELAELVPCTPEEHAVAVATASIQGGGRGVTVAWQDGRKHVLARLRLRLRLRLLVPPVRRYEVMKLAGKYPVYYVNEYKVDFVVGRMAASFSAGKREGKSKEELLKLAAALIDFEALENIEAVLEGDVDLGKKLAAGAAKHKDWHSRMQSASREVRSRQSLALQKRNELRKPYFPSRVRHQERRLSNLQGRLPGIRNELSAATIEDPEKREAERLKAAQELKHAKEGVLAARVHLGVHSKAEEIALEKLGRRARSALWEMVNAVVRMPSELGSGAPKVTASPRSGWASVSWWDGPNRQLAQARLELLPVPPPTPSAEKVAGKYPVQFWDGNSVAFSTGSVSVTVRVWKAEWQSKGRILELAPKLLDLDAIAAWPRIEDTK